MFWPEKIALVKLPLWLLGSQVDTFTISAARNIQYVLKKLVCLKVFVKHVFDMYLNNRYHIVFSLHFVRQGLGEHCLYVLPSNKRQNSTYFQIQEDFVAMETEWFIWNKESNMSEGLFVYVVLLKHF